jgi:hypothetical protein
LTNATFVATSGTQEGGMRKKSRVVTRSLAVASTAAVGVAAIAAPGMAVTGTVIASTTNGCTAELAHKNVHLTADKLSVSEEGGGGCSKSRFGYAYVELITRTYNPATKVSGPLQVVYAPKITTPCGINSNGNCTSWTTVSTPLPPSGICLDVWAESQVWRNDNTTSTDSANVSGNFDQFQNNPVWGVISTCK